MVLGKLNRYMPKKERKKERKKLDYHLLTPYTRINSKRIKDLNVRLHTTPSRKHSKLSDVALGNVFVDTSPQARDTKGKINKWDYMKLKSFCTGKGNRPQHERVPTPAIKRRHLPVIHPIRGQYPKFIKKSHNLTPKSKSD